MILHAIKIKWESNEEIDPFFLHCTNHLIEPVGGWETSCILKWEKNKDKDDTSSSQIPLFFENAILEYYVRAIPDSTALTQ